MDSFFGFTQPLLEHILGAIDAYEFRYATCHWPGTNKNVSETHPVTRSPYVVIVFNDRSDSISGPFLLWPGNGMPLASNPVQNTSAGVSWAISFDHNSYRIYSNGAYNSPPEHDFMVQLLFAFIKPGIMSSLN